MLTVTAIGRDELEAWQHYVDAHPAARPMHHAGWFGVLTGAFAIEPLFLTARAQDGSIRGVLPAYVGKSIFTGTHVASLDDGYLCDDGEAARALLDGAIEHYKARRAAYFLLRSGEPVTCELPGEPAARRATVRKVIDTSAGSDALFASLSSYARRDIRRAEKRGYRAWRDENLQRIDTDFYEHYAAQMHRLGTPVMPRKMMSGLREHLGASKVRLYLISRGQEIAGGMVCVIAKERWTALYAAVPHEFTLDYANYLLYWFALADACEARVPAMDLGRNTPGSGVYRFKQKWPGEDRYADHLYFAANASALPSLAEVYAGTTMRQRLWARLPLAVANAAGPFMRRSLPFG